MNPLKLAVSVVGASGVLLGAFGAHALASRLTGRAGELWSLAGQYQLIHAAVLVGLCAWASQDANSTWLVRASWLIVAGVALFSGSLYLMALGAPSGLGLVTPFGGLLLLAGWLCVGIRALRT